MKQLINNWSIKAKLISIIMFLVLLSLTLIGTIVIINESNVSKQSMTEQLTTLGQIISDRSTAALSFDDQKSATEMLSALGKESTVVLACLYDKQRSLFSTYVIDSSIDCPKISQQDDGRRFSGNYFELYQPINLDHEQIGTLYIRATLVKLQERQQNFIILMLSLVAFIGLLAYFISIKLQAFISKPILDLANIAKQITTEADYTVRLSLDSKDEIGALNLAFNDMLDQIHNRDLSRDLAEQALREKEQDLDVTLNSIGDAVIATDEKGCVTRMNPVAEKLTGWSITDARGLSLKTVFQIINADTRKPVKNPVDKVLSTGETVYLSNHTTLIAKDGTEYQISDSAAPIRKSDNILGIVLVFNDVTEQYQLREAAAKHRRDLQAIMDNSPTAIYVKDIEGRYIFINQQWEKLAGKQEDGVIGKVDHDIFPEETADGLTLNDKAVQLAGHALRSEEIIQHDGATRTYLSVKFPLLDDRGGIYAICGISTDITDSKQQEEILRRTQKMDALGKLTGGIAHDYNNLLGIIRGFTELLDARLAHDKKSSEYVHDIQHAAERGIRLTQKLLTFSRHKTAVSQVVNINEVIQEQKLMLEKTLTARIKLTLDLRDDLWMTEVDTGDFEDVIINMCINAMHAMESGGTLTLQTGNAHINTMDSEQLFIKKGDYVFLSIIDTGCGMDEDTRNRIFDPFYTTKGELGTGLGLSQVFGFIERTDGAIKVYSEPGRGTRFVLYFPRKEWESDTAVQVSARETTPVPRNLQGSETILIVDDEKRLVKLADNILSQQGYHVLTASDGVQALEILKNETIDLIVTDVIMPNMDGYQLADHVQHHYPNVKIQMVSGFADDRHSHIEDTDLHRNILHKPYTSNDLLVKIRNILDNNTQTNILADRTVMVVDDDENVRKLYKLIMGKLGCKVVLSENGDKAINYYQESLNSNDPIDIIVLDLNISEGMGGREVADRIYTIDPGAKIVISSGHSESNEMTRYQDFGFNGALEKKFNRDEIMYVLVQALQKD